MALHRVVVGVDGSEHAARALAWAAGLAGETGAEVVAVHIASLLVRTEAGLAPSLPEHDRLHAELNGPWTEPLRRAGVPHRCRLEDGNPVMKLLEVADEEDADFVVVGSRGSGGFSELHLGSTSHQVALYSHRPVVIVPPAGRERPGHS
jgi:nucleotide-binding universal stress UspA family protein